MQINRTAKRVTAVLVLLFGLACVYLFVPKEEQSAPGSGVLAEKPGSEAAPSHASPSPKRQAPAQLADTSGSTSIRSHEQSIPALAAVPTAVASATAPALNPVAPR